MTDPIRQVVFAACSADHDAATLDAAIRSARPRHLASGVTGALFASPGSWMQVFEGPPDAVAAALAAAVGDPWRAGGEVLIDREVPARAFPGCSLALIQSESLPAFERAEVAALFSRAEPGPARRTPARIAPVPTPPSAPGGWAPLASM